MVNITTSDILTEDRIRRVVEEEQEERLLWNQVFRDLSFPSDWSGNTINLPEEDGVMGDPERVGENSEYPREEEEYSTVSITPQKYGFEVAFSRESQLYSVFDVVNQQLEKAGRKMSELVNEKAFEEVNSNLHSNSPISGPGNLAYEVIVDGKTELQDSLYDPDLFIVNTTGENDLLKSDAFQRASDLGDDVTRSGAIGRVAGLDVMVDNSGLLDTTTGQGIMVDSEEYGYEVVRENVASEMYEAPERDADIAKLRTRRAWNAMDSDAAIKVQDS